MHFIRDRIGNLVFSVILRKKQEHIIYGDFRTHYIQVKKKANKINSKIEDVGLTED